jgi:hypothetical protein
MKGIRIDEGRRQPADSHSYPIHPVTTQTTHSPVWKSPPKKPAAKVKDLKPKKNPKGGRKAGGKQYDF